jgi:hypothetical protein
MSGVVVVGGSVSVVVGGGYVAVDILLFGSGTKRKSEDSAKVICFEGQTMTYFWVYLPLHFPS